MDFARRVMESHGWVEGKGLGVCEDGILEPIRPHLQFDTRGFCFEDKAGFSIHSAYKLAIACKFIKASTLSSEDDIDDSVLENEKFSIELSNDQLLTIHNKRLKYNGVEINNGKLLRIIRDENSTDINKRKYKRPINLDMMARLAPRSISLQGPPCDSIWHMKNKIRIPYPVENITCNTSEIESIKSKSDESKIRTAAQSNTDSVETERETLSNEASATRYDNSERAEILKDVYITFRNMKACTVLVRHRELYEVYIRARVRALEMLENSKTNSSFRPESMESSLISPVKWKFEYSDALNVSGLLNLESFRKKLNTEKKIKTDEWEDIVPEVTSVKKRKMKKMKKKKHGKKNRNKKTCKL